MALVKIPIGAMPYYNVDPISKTAEMADTVIDGYIDETGTLKRRPGLREHIDIGTGSPGQGLFYWSQMDRLIAVSGGRIWSIDSSWNVTEITGATLSKHTNVVFADGNKADGSAWLYIADGGYPVYTQGITATRLDSSRGAPANCTSICWSQGRFLAMDYGTRNFYATDTDPLTGDIEPDYFLAADNPLTAEARPDNLEYIGAHWEEILAMGNQGIEVWRSDDTFFSPIPGAFSPVGLAAKSSVVEADNTVFALCYVDNGTKLAVVKMRGREPQICSLPIENVIASYDNVSDAIGFVTPDSHYVLTFPTERVTWAYNYRLDRWYQWSYWRNYTHARGEFMGRHVVTIWGKTYMQSRFDGKIFEYSSSIYSDGGNTIRTEYVTGTLTYDTHKKKRNHYLDLHIKRGVGSLTAEPTVMIRWRDNGEPAYQIGKQREINLLTSGQRDCFVRVNNTGIFQSRQYSFIMTDDAELCLVGIEESAEVLSK